MIDRKCLRCGLAMEPGSVLLPQVIGGNGGLAYVRPGVPTSLNPITAFRQGMAGEPSDEWFRINALRCPQCGLVELIATKD